MSFTQHSLKKLEELAYLQSESEEEENLTKEINSIMDLVEQLRSVNTQGVAPLFHPFDLAQRLRTDAVSESDCNAQLEEIASLFEDGLYLVPKVID